MGQKSRLRFQGSSLGQSKKKVFVITASPEVRANLRSALRSSRTELLFASDVSEVAFFCQLVILGEGEAPDIVLWERTVTVEDLLVDLHARAPEMRVAYLTERGIDLAAIRGRGETPFDPVPTFSSADADSLASFLEKRGSIVSPRGTEPNERKEEWEASFARARRWSRTW